MLFIAYRTIPSFASAATNLCKNIPNTIMLEQILHNKKYSFDIKFFCPVKRRFTDVPDLKKY